MTNKGILSSEGSKAKLLIEGTAKYGPEINKDTSVF